MNDVFDDDVASRPFTTFPAAEVGVFFSPSAFGFSFNDSTLTNDSYHVKGTTTHITFCYECMACGLSSTTEQSDSIQFTNLKKTK